MRIIFLTLLLSFFVTAHSGERLEGISGSMKESTNPFSGWFSEEKKEQQKTLDEDEINLELDLGVKEEGVAVAKEMPNSYYDEKAGCLMQKAYILDVEDPDLYERIEDYPFKYECVTAR